MTGERTCGGCGRSFTPENTRAAYCSSPCRQRAYRRRAKGDAETALVETFLTLCWRGCRLGVLTPEEALRDAILLPPEKLERLRQEIETWRAVAA